MQATLTPVAVVGAGALGCLFGGMLARAGTAVTLIGRATHVTAIRQDGLVLESGGGKQTISLAATEDMSAVRGAGLVLFCVKSSDTEAAARAMAPYLSADTVVLSLQNGVDNVERIRAQIRTDVDRMIFTGLVYEAAQMAGPGHVRRTGGSGVVIGELTAYRRADGGNRTMLDTIATLFTSAGAQMRVSDEVEVELWTKLVMNCAYNAISALGGAPYGEMVALAEIRTLMGDAVREVVAVAAAKGIRLPEDIVAAAIKLADGMPMQISSTAQDIRRGRPTEIDHLNGYVVRAGAALGMATPVNRTLNALIKLLERRSAASV
ncbi:MAG TPA: ketopantoate reductase family protein [Xanthobacteraceae bacterium]|jgi:2-dehydropantoate 2-reductase